MIASGEKKTGGAQVIQLNIELLHFDPEVHPRVDIDVVQVGEYAKKMKSGTMFPPIDVFFDGRFYWIGDGVHRMHAAIKIERAQIAARVHQGTREDCVRFAAGSNWGVDFIGLRRSPKDKQKSVLMLLKALSEEGGLKWTDSRIAEHCGINRLQIAQYQRDQVKPANGLGSSIDENERRLSRGGRVVPVGRSGHRAPKLIKRDEQIKGLVNKGLGSSEIARKLGCKAHHVQDSKRRLGLVKHDSPLRNLHDQTRGLTGFYEVTLQELIVDLCRRSQIQDKEDLVTELKELRRTANQLLLLVNKSIQADRKGEQKDVSVENQQDLVAGEGDSKQPQHRS